MTQIAISNRLSASKNINRSSLSFLKENNPKGYRMGSLFFTWQRKPPSLAFARGATANYL